MDDPRQSRQGLGGYEPPEVADLPAADGPAVTSADGSVGDASPGPEWRGPGDKAGEPGG